MAFMVLGSSHHPRNEQTCQGPQTEQMGFQFPEKLLKSTAEQMFLKLKVFNLLEKYKFGIKLTIEVKE